MLFGMYPHARTFNRGGLLLMAMFFGTIALVATLAVPALLVTMILTEEESLRRTLGICLLASIVIGVLSRVLIFTMGHNARCPLCSGAIFHNKQCHPHERAVKYPLFTHGGSMIVDLFLRRSFRCKYCGTAFRLFK